MDKQMTVANALVGRKLSGVQKCEYSWAFVFGDSATLTAECPWRILTNGIAFTNRDHGQQFGLPAPLDGEREATRLLSNKVEQACIREDTGDLLIQFAGGVSLEILNLSFGYEAWQLCSPGRHTLLVAQGGGNVVVFAPPNT